MDFCNHGNHPNLACARIALCTVNWCLHVIGSHSDALQEWEYKHEKISAAAALEHEQEVRQLTKEATDDRMKHRSVSDSQVKRFDIKLIAG